PAVGADGARVIIGGIAADRAPGNEDGGVIAKQSPAYGVGRVVLDRAVDDVESPRKGHYAAAVVAAPAADGHVFQRQFTGVIQQDREIVRIERIAADGRAVAL